MNKITSLMCPYKLLFFQKILLQCEHHWIWFSSYSKSTSLFSNRLFKRLLASVKFHIKFFFNLLCLILFQVKKEQVSDDDYMQDEDVDLEYDENKPHCCPHCNKSFGKNSNLYGHIRRFMKKIT